MSVRVVEQIILPRRPSFYLDLGADRKVLVQKGDETLEWRPGYSVTEDMMSGQVYQPAALVLRKPEKDPLGIDLHEGGRLSKKMLSQYRAAIVEEFGEKAFDAIDTRKTVIVD